jgi:hypothetical protein
MGRNKCMTPVLGQVAGICAAWAGIARSAAAIAVTKCSEVITALQQCFPAWVVVLGSSEGHAQVMRSCGACSGGHSLQCMHEALLSFTVCSAVLGFKYSSSVEVFYLCVM